MPEKKQQRQGNEVSGGAVDAIRGIVVKLTAVPSYAQQNYAVHDGTSIASDSPPRKNETEKSEEEAAPPSTRTYKKTLPRSCKILHVSHRSKA